MTVEILLDRLQRVRQVAAGRWVACCPAHDDRSPSLSIRETETGTILLHDFGGCETSAVLDSVGLTVADLFPERIRDHTPGRPNHWHAIREAVRALSLECEIAAIAASDAAAGRPSTVEDAARTRQAAERIRAAIELCR